MNQQKLNSSLINWDLVSVNPNNKNWNWTDLFCFWGVSIQSVIGFSLITSLYVVYGLNSFVVFFGTIIASLIVYFFSNLIGLPSQKFGLPLVVLLRSSFGVIGAKYFGLLRGLVGIFMFGIQTYFLSKAIGYLIRVGIFSFDSKLLESDIFLTFFLGLNIIDWMSILLTISIQSILFSISMSFNKRIINISAIIVYLGMLLFFFSILLSDVKFTSNAFIENLNLASFFDINNLGPLVTVIGTMFAYFSIVILSFGDFSRYVKNKNELKKGNISLILNLIIFSIFSLFIVTGVDSFLRLDNENLSRVFTNPTDIIGKIDNLLITALVLVFIIIASVSTNLIANFIPSQYSLINFMPKSLSTKSSGFIIAIFGFLVSIFWLTFLSQIGILSFIDTFSAFFGPIFGIIVVDFYLINKGNLINKDIHLLDKNSAYYFSKGWHLKAIYCTFLGFIFSSSTIWNSKLMFLQSYSWMIGAFVAAFTYYLLAKK
ncbi:cytosine permease [Candidatus Pelagibacter sp.]|nr:cytosine permease [Candidatus Pelagibacter sp.]